MNNVQDMFSALFKPFNRSTSVEQQQGERDRSPVGGIGSHSNEVEEDDFLLVGQTKSERTTIYTGSFSNNIDCPPDYHRTVSEENDRLPSYAEYSSSLMDTENRKVNSDNWNSPCEDYSENNFTMTAISGVQFSLAPELKIVTDLFKGDLDTRLMCEEFLDLSKYDYDFSVEMSVLQEPNFT